MDMSAHHEKNVAARARFGSSWPILTGDEMGAPYAKTFDFPGACISAYHRFLSAPPLGRLGIPFNIDLGIDGYLQVGDALKLFELAYFAPGDVLELGTHLGLSASIIARALSERGAGKLETIDIDASTTARAGEALSGAPGAERITFTVQDAPTRMDELIAEGRKFGFIFIDHWHGYEATVDAARRCANLLAPGGCVQFHDLLNPENIDPGHIYGVYQAVLDTVCEDQRFAFRGVSGCTAIFQFQP